MDNTAPRVLAEIIEVECLPAGPGILPSEIGKHGPWRALRYPSGRIFGWALAPGYPGLQADEGAEEAQP